MPFGWSMCDIWFCISWPEKITGCNIAHRPIPFGWSMFEIRLCIYRQKCQPGLVVDNFGDLSKMEIVQKRGLVADV